MAGCRAGPRHNIPFSEKLISEYCPVQRCRFDFNLQQHMSICFGVRALGLFTVCMVSPASCWTSSHCLQCTYNIVRRNQVMAISKVRMADTARPEPMKEPKLFGSRRLYRWMHKNREDDNQCIELIKLITIAKLHSDVAMESTRAPPQVSSMLSRHSLIYFPACLGIGFALTNFLCRISSRKSNSAVNHAQPTV